MKLQKAKMQVPSLPSSGAAVQKTLPHLFAQPQRSTKGKIQGWEPSPVHLLSSWRKDSWEAVLGPAISTEMGFSPFKFSFGWKHQGLRMWIRT